jgi:hypothetical protein
VNLPQGIAPDSLRRVLDSVFAGRDYHWVVRPASLLMLRHGWDLFRAWLQRWHDADPLLFQIAGWALVALLVALVVHAGWSAAHGVRADDADAAGRDAHPAARGADWYRTEARRLASAGAYPDAMQAEFIALVLALDAARVLRFQASKTPGEYVAELRGPPATRADFRALVNALYSYAFARRPCGPEEYAAWHAHAQPERYASAN